jgi:hypothetical protein
MVAPHDAVAETVFMKKADGPDTENHDFQALCHSCGK